ncbi:SPOR domain-containing protein [Streptomyces meridianus]|uniref:SPOR domain-containing protein n=1 Tax=Streptomyces meridianus TaxID=2938945 RepID=A0ABT0X243_9ACTN|nr:SPOR domain-containing protein [Streptomyces meridianus]MCM2576245.1 SPOR domain-containing protein [Streptomyces meridianus]
MSERATAVQPWLVIRQDGNGNRYRVASYPTRAEAERVAARLDGQGPGLYAVERLGRRS